GQAGKNQKAAFSFGRVKAKGQGVDAIAQASWRRAIGEYMSQMGIANIAKHFLADHAVRRIGFFSDIVRIDWFKITWPAATGIELGVGSKQRRAASDTRVDAWLEMVPVLTGKGAFRAFLARYLEAFRGKQFAPLLFGLDDFHS